jgi:hypothetical protein
VIALDHKNRKLMMNANLRVRVADVQKMTTDIEAIVQGMNGLVVKSEMVNEISNQQVLPYSNDSLLQLSVYSATSFMELRVPSQYVDSFLRLTADKSEFILNRNLVLEDASFQYLNNELHKRNGAARQDLMRARGFVNEAEEAIQVATFAARSAREDVDRTVENFAINDRVKYPTITLAILQPDKIDHVVIANISKQMSPGYGLQLQDALHAGWEGFKLMLIGIVYVWPLWIVGSIIWIGIRRRNKTAKPVKPVAL